MKPIALFSLFLSLSLVPAQERIRSKAVEVPLSDGALAKADLYLPAGEDELYPTVLLITPYNRAQESAHALPFAKAGYATLVQNMRGKGGSEGDFLPFIDEIPDHLAVLDWILEQEWCDGNIALFGGSSQSYSAQLLASTGHPAIKALVNVSGLTDTQDLFFPGGAYRLDTLYPWLYWNYLDKGLLSSEEWDERFRRVPVADGFEWDFDLFARMAAGTVQKDRIEVPTLHFTGWNDVVYRHTLSLYEGLRTNEFSPEQMLIIGPWMHNQIGAGVSVAGEIDYGSEAAMNRDTLCALTIRWLDRQLGEEGNAAGEYPQVRWFAMGENRWREAGTWPPAEASEMNLFLASDGRLLDAAEEDQASASYEYDPEKPIPTWGGVNSHIFPDRAGPRDQARFAEREDLLVFQSEPMAADLMLAGPMRVQLHAASSAVDTDFCAKLIVIAPDGYQLIVEDGIQRAKFRNGREPQMLEPGEVYEYSIELGHTGLLVPAGHRLALHVSSSNFPKYDRNPNTGEDPLLAEDFELATQRVFFGGETASRLLLTVMDEAR
ncbi:MAG: CocE/NonD family hydrolase [Planctomycetota bacterium]|jgi:predicted acyl esterase